MKKKSKNDSVRVCLLFFYFKCSETSRDSVGHFGLNSLPPSLTQAPTLPRAPSLALPLALSKGRSFLWPSNRGRSCDAWKAVNHETGRPPSRLKGAAAPPPAWFLSVRRATHRQGTTVEPRAGRATPLELFSLKPAKKAAGCAHSTLRLWNR